MSSPAPTPPPPSPPWYQTANYTLWRTRPDERQVVGGAPFRAGSENEPAACELLPGEEIEIRLTYAATGGSRKLATLALDEQGQLYLLPIGAVSFVVAPSQKPGEFAVALCDGDGLIASTFSYLDDVRVFAQVFPRGRREPDEETPVPAE